MSSEKQRENKQGLKRERDEATASGAPSPGDAGTTPNTPNGGAHKKPKAELKAKQETEQPSSPKDNQTGNKGSTKRKRGDDESEQEGEDEASSSNQATGQATSSSATHKKLKNEQQKSKQETKTEAEKGRWQEEQAWHFGDDRGQAFPNENPYIKEKEAEQVFEIETKETKQSSTISSSSNQSSVGNAGLQSTSFQITAVEWTDTLLSDLPHALLFEVLQKLKPRDSVAVASTSKAMNEVMKDEMLWCAYIERDFKRAGPKMGISHVLNSIKDRAGKNDSKQADLKEQMNLLVRRRNVLQQQQVKASHEKAKKELESLDQGIRWIDAQLQVLEGSSAAIASGIPDTKHSSAASTSRLSQAYLELSIPGDGDCLYSAVALYVGQAQHQLRNQVADELERNPEEYRPFLELKAGQTSKDYIDGIRRRGGEWAGQVEIRALMKILQRPVIVIRPGQNAQDRVLNPDKNLGEDQYFGKGTPIPVKYNGHNHYDALVMVEEQNTPPKSSQNHLLDARTIYRHLRAHSTIEREDVNLFVERDPAIFQSALNDDEYASLYSREVCLYKAARVGNIALVKWLIDKARGALRVIPHGTQKRTLFNKSTFDAAMESGYLPLAEMMVAIAKQDKDKFSETVFLNSAASFGHLSVVQLLIEEGFTPKQGTLTAAAGSGELKLVELLITKDLRPNQATLAAAARSGELKLVELLIETYKLTPDQDTLTAAARSGELKLVELLIETYKLTPDQDTLTAAARSGELKLVELLIEKYKLTPDQDTLNAAIESGNLELVEWLVSPKRGKLQLALDDKHLDRAAAWGHLEIVKFLVEKRNIYHTLETLEAAALYGHLDVLKWLATKAPVPVGKDRPCADNEVLVQALDGVDGHFVYQQVVNWLLLKASPALETDFMPAALLWQLLGGTEDDIDDGSFSATGLLWMGLYAPEGHRIRAGRNHLLRLARLGQVEQFDWLISDAPAELQLTPDADVLWAALTTTHPDKGLYCVRALRDAPVGRQVRLNQETLARFVREIQAIPSGAKKESKSRGERGTTHEGEEGRSNNALSRNQKRRARLFERLRWWVSKAPEDVRIAPTSATLALATDPELHEFLSQHVVQPAEDLASSVSSSSSSFSTSAQPLSSTVTAVLSSSITLWGNGGRQTQAVASNVDTNSTSNTESASSSSSSSSTPQPPRRDPPSTR